MDSWIVGAAAKELRELEAEHPDRFDYLKLELKTFMSETSHHLFSPSPLEHTDVVDTQVSSTDDDNNTRKRRRRCSPSSSWQTSSEPAPVVLVEAKKKCKKKDRVDLALEKAAECLRKIRRLKEILSFGRSSTGLKAC